MMIRINRFLKSWRESTEGIAAVESALVFPILMTLMLGTFDMGNGILANQKSIRASQVVGDLVTRERSVDTAMLNEAVEAGELALQPFNTSSYGVDVVSIRFDENSVPEIVWRETRNMTPVADVLLRVDPVSAPNEGVVVVTVQYRFEPVFSGFIVGDIVMQETAYTHGRKSAVVTRT